MAIKYTRRLVIYKAKQTFSNGDISQIMQFLDAYGKENHEHERERVQLATLKLCQGNLEILKQMIELAKIDYRDVLALAEYPNQSSYGFVRYAELSIQEKDRLNAEDLKQYLNWLK